MKNTEIEKRFICKNKNSILKKLNNIAKQLYTNHQIDSYYIPKHRNFVAEKYPFEWLRLRRENNQYTLTYKHWYPERVKESTHCDEYETIIENGKNFEKILYVLDFKKIIVVDKKRTAYKLDKFEIAIDDVKDLGSFIEIEIKSKYNSIDEAIKKIYTLAKELDLKELAQDHPVRTGYPLPLYRKKRNIL